MLSFIISSPADAQDSGLLTGKRLQTELNRPGTIYWSDSPIREAFAGITNNRRVPVWIDRRCDPSHTVTLISQAALSDCLWELTQINEQLDVAWSQDLVYVGPPGEANRWATVNQRHREMLKRLPRAQRERWMSARSWHWNRLKNPQDLLRDLESELGQSIQGGHLIEHDLWPAAAYPPLPLFVRLELLLAGYGQTFVFASDGNAIVRRMPVAPRVTRANPIEPGHPKEKVLSKIITTSPSAELSENRLRLTASWSVHERIRRAVTPIKARPGARSRRNVRYTLRAKDQPLGVFLGQLSNQLQLECEFSPMAKTKANEMISFEVEKVSLRQLLSAIVEPLSLEYSLDENKLHIKTQSEP